MSPRLRHLGQRLLRGEGLPAWAGPLTGPARLGWVIFRRMTRDKAFLRAAGMAYNTLVALVPLLMLVFGVLGAVGVLDQNQAAIDDLVFRSFLGNIPEVREFLLPGLLGVDLGAMGLVGIGGLAVVAFRLYAQVELAYNEIFGTVLERPFIRRLMYFYVTATFAPVLVITLLLRSSELTAALGVDAAFTSLSNLSGVAVQYLLLVTALKTFPSTEVPWRSALVGALVTTLLLGAAGQGFAAYLVLFAADDPVRVIYGSVGVLPVFLLWLYLAWLTVLIGVEVAAVAQGWRTIFEAEYLAEQEGEDGVDSVPGPDSLLLVAALLARRYEDAGGPFPTPQLAAAAGLRERELLQVLRVLEPVGHVARAEAGWLLARPSETVAVRDLLSAWRARTSPHASLTEAPDAALRALRAELDAGLQGSLAELIGRLPSRPPSAP